MSRAPDNRSKATDHDRAWSGLLRQIIELSTEERSLRSVLRRVADLVVATTRADVCFVHVVDPDADELVLMGATPPFDEVAGTIRLKIGQGLAGWVAQHAEPAVVENKWRDPRYVYIPALRGKDFSSLISVPLLRPEGVVVGVLNVHSRKTHHFARADVDRLSEVASLLAGIVENAVLFDRITKREIELERFAARTIELQELDRRRIAADIHDGISQRLVSAWYYLRAARSSVDSSPIIAELAATESLLSDALEEARRAVVGLRPVVLDDLGLTAGLTSLAGSLGTDADVDIDLDECRLATHIETALYRIAQEALQNVAKHAQASRVVIKLRDTDDRVRLSIEDDGVGFDRSRSGSPMSFGIDGMRERAVLLGADLEVSSRVGAGTSVVVTILSRGDGSLASGAILAAPAGPPP